MITKLRKYCNIALHCIFAEIEAQGEMSVDSPYAV